MWLMDLLLEMQRTVRYEMQIAVVSYEEKIREVWVYDPPAQVALCVCQIWWTVEVNITFQRLEEGYENALKDYNKKQVCCVRDAWNGIEYVRYCSSDSAIYGSIRLFAESGKCQSLANVGQ